MKQILINAGGLETRVAVVSDGKLEEYFIERRDEDRLVGSIFKGRINNLEPSLQAAFVDIGFEKNAFLHYWDMIPATQDMLEEDGDRQADELVAVLPPEVKDEGTVPAKRQTLLDMLKQVLFPKPEPETETSATKSDAEEQNRQSNDGGRGRNQQQRRGGRRGGPQPRRKQKQVTVDDIPSLFRPGTEVLVQVTKGPISTKGPRVTTNLSLPGRYLVMLPNSNHIGISKRIESSEERNRLRKILRALPLPPNMGIICRTVGAGKSEKAFQRDLANLLGYWKQAESGNRAKAPCCVYQEPEVVERTVRDYLADDIDEIITDSKPLADRIQEMMQNFARDEEIKVRYYNQPKPLFQKFNLTEQIDSIFSRRVALPSGGYLVLDETEALIAIDINSGRNRSGKDHPETILSTNLEAVQEIARQLRLRNVGGLIVIDFIDMRGRKDQQTVYRALKDALLADRAKTKAMPLSPLGLVEMTRQRERESLQDAVYEDCPYCSGRGLVKSPQSVSVEIQRRLQEILRRYRGNMQVRVTVHPRIFDRLKIEDADLIKLMETETHCELSFRSDGTIHMEEFKVHDLISGEEL